MVSNKITSTRKLFLPSTFHNSFSLGNGKRQTFSLLPLWGLEKQLSHVGLACIVILSICGILNGSRNVSTSRSWNYTSFVAYAVIVALFILVRLATLRVLTVTDEGVLKYNHNETDEKIFEVWYSFRNNLHKSK